MRWKISVLNIKTSSTSGGGGEAHWLTPTGGSAPDPRYRLALPCSPWASPVQSKIFLRICPASHWHLSHMCHSTLVNHLSMSVSLLFMILRVRLKLIMEWTRVFVSQSPITIVNNLQSYNLSGIYHCKSWIRVIQSLRHAFLALLPPPSPLSQTVTSCRPSPQ